jgi:hypothetical protein
MYEMEPLPQERIDEIKKSPAIEENPADFKFEVGQIVFFTGTIECRTYQTVLCFITSRFSYDGVLGYRIKLAYHGKVIKLPVLETQLTGLPENHTDLADPESDSGSKLRLVRTVKSETHVEKHEETNYDLVFQQQCAALNIHISTVELPIILARLEAVKVVHIVTV